MATKTLYIELQVTGIDSEERMQALTEALRGAGRQLHAAATLICADLPAPVVTLSAEDMVDGRTEISTEERL